MEKKLKILILEDSKTDAEIIQRMLLKHSPNYEFHLAMTKKNFLLALDEFSPDAILSDNSLPGFSSIEALKITRQRFMHIPFILVTGTVSEEYAANVIKEGADDYILKDRMARLPAAIEAAIKQRKLLKELIDYKYALDESAIVTITDQKGIILYANDNFCKISKYRADELIGQDHRIVNSGYHPASYFKDLWVTITGGKVWQGELRNKAKDGSFYWVDANIIPLLNDKGNPYQYLAIRTDITERKKAEEQLTEREEQLELFIEHSPASLAMFDNEMRYVAVSRRWINDYKLGEQSLIGKTHYDVFPGIPQRWKDIHQDCLKGAIVKNEEDSFIRNDGTTSWLRWEIRPWHKASGEIGGIIIFSEDITERKIADQQLKISEEKYRTIFLKSPLPKWIYDSETLRFLDVNDAAIRHYGYTRQEFLSMTIKDIRPKEDIELLLNDLDKIKDVPDARKGLWRHLKKNGDMIIVETSAHVIDYNNRRARMVVINDTTEKIKSQQELQAAYDRLSFHIENAPLGFIEWDSQLHVKSWSKQAEEIFGWTEKEFISLQKNGYTQVYEEDSPLAAMIAEQLITGAIERNSVQHRNYTKDGRVIWCEWFNSVLKEKNGKVITILSLVQDVTERKNAEEDLRQSEMKLKEAQAIAHISNWEIDMVKNVQNWSDEFYRIFGLDKVEHQPSTELFLSLMHPDDVVFAQNQVRDAFEKLYNSSFTFRFVRNNDSAVRYGYTEWHFEFDKKRNPVRLFGILQDITERKDAEENLRLLEEKILEQRIEEQKKIARAMITGQEKERNFIGQELHDNINQLLAGTKMFLGIAGKKSEEAMEIVKYPIELIDSSIKEIRLLSHRLVTPLKNIDLEELITDLLGKLAQNKIEIAFTYSVPDKLLSDDLKLNIYRIIQEQVNNILKYAEAKKVNISVEARGNNILTVTEDDGKGFDVSSKIDGIGISNMINRAETFNGQVDIESSPGNGCKISIIIPC